MFTRKSGQNRFGTATCTSLPGEISQSVWECFDDLGLDKNCNDTALKCVSLTRLRHSIRLELRLLSSGSWAASPSSPQKNSRYQPVQKKKKEWRGEGTYHWTSLRRRLTKEGFTSLWKCWFEVMWSKVSFCEWFWCGIFKSRCKLLDNLWLTKSAKDR